jgi:hypothetical protein
MEWWQTLIVAAVPAAVAAASLIIQAVMNNQRESERVGQEAAERDKERTHAEAMAREAREHEQEVAAAQRKDDADAELKALHVEMLTALDEIYVKLLAHRRLTQQAPQRGELVYLAPEPDLTRLVATHSALRIRYDNDDTIKPLATAVDLLVELHHVAAATAPNKLPNLSGLDSYPEHRRLYIFNVTTDRIM